MYEAMRPAISTASDFAKKSGSPYGVLITTTPSTLDLEAGKYCYQMIQNSAKWTERIYDWFIDDEEYGREELEQYLESNSNNNYIYIEYSYKQLGKDDIWLKKQEREIGSLEAVKRELLLQWTYSSSDSVFEEEVLEEVSQYADKDFYSELLFDYKNKGKYIFHIIDKMNNMYEKNWLIGVDVGGGLGRDNTAVTVIDPATNKPIMHFFNNTITNDTLRLLLTDLINNYIPKAVLVIERNYAGKALIDEILNEGKISSNLFYSNKTRSAEQVVQHNKEMFRPPNKKVKREVRVYGVDTTKKTRDIMLNEILSSIINDNPHWVNNRELFLDIKGLQYTKAGKIEHGPGGHDDTLFSYLVALYALFYERDINKFVKVKHGNKLTVNDKGEVIAKANDEDFKRSVITNMDILNQDHSSNDLYNSLIEEHGKNKSNSFVGRFNDIMKD